MATFTLAKLIADWDLLNTALQSHLTDLPFLKDKAAELDALVAEAKEMDTQQQDLRGALQETVRQRQELEKRGKDLHLRVAALLRGSLGFDNQKLLGFGLKPRRPRRKKTPEDAPAPEPSAQS
jgi:chromosome segregation ATPase